MNKVALSLLISIGASILFVLGAVLYRLALPPAQPFEYTQGEYQAERPIYAPGDTLIYTASLTVKRPGAIEIVRGFRTRPKSGRARLCNGENAKSWTDLPPPFPPDAVETDVEGRVPIAIPDLPAGDYWLVSSASKKDGGESITKVAFSVEKPC